MNVDMPSVLLELFIALDCDECEGEFYEEVEPCDYETEGKLRLDHSLSYVFVICMKSFITMHVLLKHFANNYC